jgi:hypothetical protein
MGICHSYAPDGRCISLLKILLINACNYDCLYGVNRATSNVPRARFTVDEAVKLTRLLSPQLHRGTVSLLRHHPQRRGNKALPFIVLSDHRPSPHLLDGARLAERFSPAAKQLGFGL